MEFVLFPHAFLDLPSVSDLPAEHKLALCAVAVHPRTSACAVLTATPYVRAGLPLGDEVFSGVIADLDRRGVVVADDATSEIFLADAFSWHRVPAEGEDSGWARQVAAAAGRVRSSRVCAAVRRAIAFPPPSRLHSIKIPSNLLTAMPPRGRGQAWSASETLAHFAFAVNPDQTPAGVFSPQLAALAAFCSLPIPTVLECVDSLSAARGLVFECATGEIFVPARFRAAADRDIGKIQRVAETIRSPRVFRALASAAKRRFPKIVLKTGPYLLGEERGGDVSEGDTPPPNFDVARKFHLRHGVFKNFAPPP